MLGSDEPAQLLIVGPSDEVDQEIHAAGRYYTAGALVVHERCLAELDDIAVEKRINELYMYIKDDW